MLSGMPLLCFQKIKQMAYKRAFQLTPLGYKITMSGSGSRIWPILTEFACAMENFEKKSK